MPGEYGLGGLVLLQPDLAVMPQVSPDQVVGARVPAYQLVAADTIRNLHLEGLLGLDDGHVLVPPVLLDVALQHGDAQFLAGHQFLLDDVRTLVVLVALLRLDQLDLVGCPLLERLRRVRPSLDARTAVPAGERDVHASAEPERGGLGALRLETLAPSPPPTLRTSQVVTD